MVSICSILYKMPLCKLFGGVGCWFGVDGCNRFIVFQTHVSCSKTKKYVSMLNYKSFSIFKKCFSTSQSFKSSDILYLSIHLFPFSTYTYISTQDRCTVLPHIIQSKYSTFGDKPKRLLFFFFLSRGNSVVFFWERIRMKEESQKFPSHQLCA